MKIKKTIKIIFSVFLFTLFLQSCVSKKEILYMQDLDSYSPTELYYNNNEIQIYRLDKNNDYKKLSVNINTKLINSDIIKIDSSVFNINTEYDVYFKQK